nr:MAG TPA: hypothetical protein [Caudoviricetes sp.]
MINVSICLFVILFTSCFLLCLSVTIYSINGLS